MSRTSVSIPEDLRRRMTAAGKSVNWSQVASMAFEKKLSEIKEVVRVNIPSPDLVSYDWQQKQISMEWFLPDRRIGLVLDNEGTSSWFCARMVQDQGNMPSCGPLSEYDWMRKFSKCFEGVVEVKEVGD